MTNDSVQTRILPDELRTSVLPAPGTILRERYRLDSELGRGGMGTVYRATDLELQREVAVKVISATCQGSDAHERLIREARAAAALNHPHIVTIHDVGESAGFPFLVMELVGGPRLSDARPTDLSRVVAIAVQICAALVSAVNLFQGLFTAETQRDAEALSYRYSTDASVSQPIRFSVGEKCFVPLFNTTP